MISRTWLIVALITMPFALRAAEVVWVDDSVPAGAIAVGDSDGWNWVSTNPPPFSGGLSHRSNVLPGVHQHYFYGATTTLWVPAGEKLFCYVYLDPANLPAQIMLQWNDGWSWEHRAYWGANLIPWGTDGTMSRRYMGALPAPGVWWRLEVPASEVGLEGQTLNGMAFTLYGGRATWDRAGKGTSPSTTYHVGQPNNQLVSMGPVFGCDTSLYDPEVYMMSTGKLVLWGQGGSKWSCSRGIDSIYTATYNPAVNNWQVPSATDCPRLTGVRVCDHLPTIPDETGPVGSPSAVKLNGKVYMAYVAGNADYERGKINWAVGTDTNLSIYPSASNPVALITPMQSGKTACDKHGVGQVRLVYENGFFYFILFYGHNREVGNGPYSTLAYRINYDPASSWGLGSTRQIFTAGQWVAHDGNLIFNYDSPTGLPVWGNYDARGLIYGGEGDLKWDPVRLRWIHIYSTWDTTKLSWQETTSLESGTWSTPVDVDVSKIRAKYPNTPLIGAGLWWGDVSPDGITNPRMHAFVPVHGGAQCFNASGQPNVFGGLSVAMATLDYY